MYFRLLLIREDNSIFAIWWPICQNGQSCLPWLRGSSKLWFSTWKGSSFFFRCIKWVYIWTFNYSTCLLYLHIQYCKNWVLFSTFIFTLFHTFHVIKFLLASLVNSRFLHCYLDRWKKKNVCRKIWKVTLVEILMNFLLFGTYYSMPKSPIC